MGRAVGEGWRPDSESKWLWSGRWDEPGLALRLLWTSHPGDHDSEEIRVGPLADGEGETSGVYRSNFCFHSEIPFVVGIQSGESCGYSRF